MQKFLWTPENVEITCVSRACRLRTVLLHVRLATTCICSELSEQQHPNVNKMDFEVYRSDSSCTM